MRGTRRGAAVAAEPAAGRRVGVLPRLELSRRRPRNRGARGYGEVARPTRARPARDAARPSAVGVDMTVSLPVPNGLREQVLAASSEARGGGRAVPAAP